MKSKKWPRMKSPLHKVSSMILTPNSRAGCDMAAVPSPIPYHFPVHHALFVSSCLNSLVRNTDMKILLIARWIATIAMIPRTACEASQRSRNHWKRILG